MNQSETEVRQGIVITIRLQHAQIAIADRNQQLNNPNNATKILACAGFVQEPVLGFQVVRCSFQAFTAHAA